MTPPRFDVPVPLYLRLPSVAIFLMLLPIAAQATERINPFSASVPAEDQSSESRELALTAALRQVLVKLSGREETSRYATAAAAQNLVQQFGFRTLDEQLYFEAGFDPAAVVDFAKQQGVPIWPLERPIVVVWLVASSPEDEQVVPADSELGSHIVESARARGVPVIFPLWDLSERGAVSLDGLGRRDAEQLKTLSEPYRADVVLAGRLDTSLQGGVNASWQLKGAGADQTWNDAAIDDREAVAAAMARVTRTLAAGLGDAGGELNAVRMTALGVADFRSFTRLQRFLSSHSALGGFRPLALRSTGYDLVLQSRVAPAQLRELFAASDVLELMPGGEEGTDLTFFVVPE